MRGVTKADKAGVGLPFLRLVTGNMRNFIRLRKVDARLFSPQLLLT